MSNLDVSVIIPTYNRATLVPRAVRSALANVLPGDEILVVDDGSTDDTEEALRPFQGQIRYERLPHGGAGVTRNIGASLATKALIAYLDSDDEWLPGKLALQRAFMAARPDILFCFSDFTVREQNGNYYPRYLAQWHQDPRSWDEILGPGVPFSSITSLPEGQEDFQVHFGDLYLPLMYHDYVATFTIVIRREQAGEALHFAEDVATYEDWECFARLARAGTAAYLDLPTACQHGHAGARLTDAREFDQATSRLRILERVWGSDPRFLASHRDLHTRVCAKHHLRRAEALIHKGQTRQARTELRLAGASPLSYRLLASLPGPLARGLLGVRRSLRSLRPTLAGPQSAETSTHPV